MVSGFDAISVYTRTQAILEGDLVDLSTRWPDPTNKYFRYQVACASRVWEILNSDENISTSVRELLSAAISGHFYSEDPTTVYFNLVVGGITHELKVVCETDDDGLPCLTIHMRNDD